MDARAGQAGDGTGGRTGGGGAGTGAATGAVVASLHRYPVKSLLGEQVDELEVDARGCAGDRVLAVGTGDGMLGSGKAGRRFTALPGLQLLRARTVAGQVRLLFPDGEELAADDPRAARRLGEHVGRPVDLVREDGTPHHDDGPVSLLGTASVGAVAAELGAEVAEARFRANLVLRTTEPWAEDAWEGRRLQVGTVVLDVVATSPRCVMVDAGSADRPAQPGVLRAVGRVHGADLGVVAEVVGAGVVRVGDEVRLVGDGAPGGGLSR